MTDFLQKLALLGIGWALGFFTPLIKSAIEGRKRKKKVRNGIATELDDLRQRLALAATTIEMISGGMTKDSIRYLKERVKPDFFPPSMQVFMAVTDRLLDTADKDFSAAAAQVKAKQAGGISLSKYSIPYTTTKLGDVSDFSEPEQQGVLQVVTHLDLLNQYVEESLFYRNLTFSSSIEENNHEIAVGELKRCREHVATQGRIIVEMIENLTPKLR
ncbi:MAG: hypothetical protein WD342_12860 [Verrucomicrobiales bacterium]